MHAGALRALEFDRIVAVVSGLAVTPTGEARLAELHPVSRRASGNRPATRDDGGHAVPRPITPDFRCARPRISRRSWTRSRSTAVRSSR